MFFRFCKQACIAAKTDKAPGYRQRLYLFGRPACTNFELIFDGFTTVGQYFRLKTREISFY